MKKFIKELIVRIGEQTPKRFRQLRRIFQSIGVASLAALAFSDKLPQWLMNIYGYGIVIGSIGVFMASLPVCDTDKLEEKLKQ